MANKSTMSRRSGTHITIKGGNNQIVQSTQHMGQYHRTATTLQDRRKAENIGFTHQVYVTHNSVDVGSMICKAKHNIVLHAAYYPKYGHDELAYELYNSIGGNSSLRLTVIFTETADNPWLEEFTKILRPYFSEDEFVRELENSRRHFLNMRNKFGAARVRVLSSGRLPMFPIIMIDNTLIIGHYAHSQVPAPEGLWLKISHPKISKMYEDLSQGKNVSKKYITATEKAILRYVEELVVR